VCLLAVVVVADGEFVIRVAHDHVRVRLLRVRPVLARQVLVPDRERGVLVVRPSELGGLAAQVLR
jgi:hypothetical protein